MPYLYTQVIYRRKLNNKLIAKKRTIIINYARFLLIPCISRYLDSIFSNWQVSDEALADYVAMEGWSIDNSRV